MDPDSVYIILEKWDVWIYWKETRRIPQKHRITTFMNIKFLTIDELNSAWMMEQMVFFLEKKKWFWHQNCI